MPDYLKAWFEELDRRWKSGEKLSSDDQHRLNYLRSTYLELAPWSYIRVEVRVEVPEVIHAAAPTEWIEAK